MPAQKPPKAIRSEREDEPELEEHLEVFIAGLGETVDFLQDAEAANDPARLRIQALELADTARELGYPALAEMARHVAISCDEGNPDARHKAVRDLTELSQRVRRGHRASA